MDAKNLGAATFENRIQFDDTEVETEEGGGERIYWRRSDPDGKCETIHPMDSCRKGQPRTRRLPERWLDDRTISLGF